MKTIVETLIEAGEFNALVTAVKGAFLLGSLMGPGPFTLLAPTDDAFAKLPPGAFEALFEERAHLAAVVMYHIVPGKIMARDFMSVNSAPTAQGEMLEIKASERSTAVNDAQIVQADIECSNGVIHVIDTVLLPAAQKMAA